MATSRGSWTCVDLFRRQPIESQRDRVPLVYHVARDHARQSKARSPPIVTQSGGRLSQTGYMGGLYHLKQERYGIKQSKPSRRSQSKFMVGVYVSTRYTGFNYHRNPLVRSNTATNIEDKEDPS